MHRNGCERTLPREDSKELKPLHLAPENDVNCLAATWPAVTACSCSNQLLRDFGLNALLMQQKAFHAAILGSARFRSPAELLLPGGYPELAFFLEVVALLELPLPCIATEKGVAVLVDAVAEVLTCHADTGSFPALKLPLVDEIHSSITPCSNTHVLLRVVHSGQEANG